jgi:hypothetical protein
LMSLHARWGAYGHGLYAERDAGVLGARRVVQSQRRLLSCLCVALFHRLAFDAEARQECAAMPAHTEKGEVVPPARAPRAQGSALIPLDTAWRAFSAQLVRGWMRSSDRLGARVSEGAGA